MKLQPLFQSLPQRAEQGLQKAGASLVGASLDSFARTSSSLKAAPRLLQKSHQAIWSNQGWNWPVKAAVTATLPAAAVAGPLMAAVTGAVSGLIGGFQAGTPQQAAQWAQQDQQNFLKFQGTLEQALEENHNRPGQARTPQQELQGMAGGALGAVTSSLLNTAVAIQDVPEVLVRGWDLAESHCPAGPVGACQASTAVTGGALLYPLATAVTSLASGYRRGYEAGAESGPLAGFQRSVEDAKGFHSAVTERGLEALETLSSIGQPAQPAKLDPQTRFCIVGAGPAGLGAARRLAEKGYQNITVLEKAPEAGGKVKSKVYDGRTYELGAVVAPTFYRTIRNIAQEVGVEERLIDRPVLMSLNRGGVNEQPLSASQQLGLPFQAAKYVFKSLTDWKDTLQPGYANVNPQLHQPMSELCQQEGLGALEKLFQGHSTGLGYGFFDEVPAAYFNKYFGPNCLEPNSQWFAWKEGYQEVLKRVAAEPGKTVVYGSQIQGIERGEHPKVTTEKGTQEFDQVILACPLAQALDFLPANGAEKELLSQVKTYDYRVIMAHAEGLPQNVSYIEENLESDRLGHPSAFYRRYPDSDLYTFYSICHPDQSDEEVVAKLQGDIKQLGGQVKEVRDVIHWEYFPHVDSQSMDQGFYQKLEQLEGDNLTVVGEINAFSTVNHSLENAQRVMDKKF